MWDSFNQAEHRLLSKKGKNHTDAYIYTDRGGLGTGRGKEYKEEEDFIHYAHNAE